MKKVFLMLCGLLLSWNASALEVAGVKLADSGQLGGQTLVLNGAGIRSKFVFDLYVAALYLPEKRSVAAAVLADGGEKRMALHLLRDIDADHLLSAFNNAIAANHTPAERSALEGSLKEFSSIFNTMQEVKKGDVITLDYLPSIGTQVSVNGIVKGMVAGSAFNTALLKIWLGDKPAQADLKQKLLGGQ